MSDCLRNSDEYACAYPNMAGRYHRILPDNVHDANNAIECRCCRAPLRASLRDLTDEMVRARTKFPKSRYLVTALGEEIGELAEALEKAGVIPPPQFVNLVKHYGDLQRWTLQRRSRDEIRTEALQTACIAMRLYEEIDPLYENVDDEAAQI